MYMYTSRWSFGVYFQKWKKKKKKLFRQMVHWRRREDTRASVSLCYCTISRSWLNHFSYKWFNLEISYDRDLYELEQHLRWSVLKWGSKVLWPAHKIADNLGGGLEFYALQIVIAFLTVKICNSNFGYFYYFFCFILIHEEVQNS